MKVSQPTKDLFFGTLTMAMLGVMFLGLFVMLPGDAPLVEGH